MPRAQQVLFLWLDNSALDSAVTGWAYYDGADLNRTQEQRPYARGVDALADGWRLISTSPLRPSSEIEHLQADHLRFEFVFERFADLASTLSGKDDH